MNHSPFELVILKGTPSDLNHALRELARNDSLALWTTDDEGILIPIDDCERFIRSGPFAWQLQSEFRPVTPNDRRFRFLDSHTPDEICQFAASTVIRNGWTLFLWGDGGAGNLCFALTTDDQHIVREIDQRLVSAVYHIRDGDVVNSTHGILYSGTDPGAAVSQVVVLDTMPLVVCDHFGEYRDPLWPYDGSQELKVLGELFPGEGKAAVYRPSSDAIFRQMCAFSIARQRELIAFPGKLTIADASTLASLMSKQNWTDDIKLLDRVHWIFAAARGRGELANQYLISKDSELRQRVIGLLGAHKILSCF